MKSIADTIAGDGVVLESIRNTDCTTDTDATESLFFCQKGILFFNLEMTSYT